MAIADMLTCASPAWMDGSGPDADIVISSRIRLARNLEGLKFPQAASEADLRKVKSLVRSACTDINEQGGWGRFLYVDLEDLTELDRQVLVEKHLISPQHAALPVGRALMVREDEMFSVMVNEEDHLRIQCLFSGLQLEQAWVAITGLDDALEARLDYAYCVKRGYLTACPTNVGTGIRASVMMHLPALVIAGLAGGIFTAASKVGMVVRGIYGEGTEAMGNIFQLSNQVTLGQSEEEILSNLQVVARQIIDQERSARAAFLRDMKEQIEDRVFRAFGILQHARILPSDEAIKKWSDVRLGHDTGLIRSLDRRSLNKLIVATRPAFIQRVAGRPLSAFERDLQRAALVRRTMVAAGQAC